MGLSHQKAHRDYENADSEQQQKFVATIKKKLQELKPRERLTEILHHSRKDVAERTEM
jgi:hypothetical protein